MSLTLGIFGTGRLGALVAQVCADAPGVTVAWNLGRTSADEFAALAPVDVAIDVSHADGVEAHLAWARERDIPLVLGVTGWPAELLEQSSPERAEPGTHPALPAVLLAPNFSLSLALMRRLTAVIGRYANPEAAGDRGVEGGQGDLAVFDRHHRGKVDSPSGTALLLADTLREAAGPAGPQVQVAAQRLGQVVGFHQVSYTDGLETVTLSHESHDRSVYAHGALAAARWLDRHRGERGIRTFDEVADDLLTPLFAQPAAAETAPPPAAAAQTA